MFHPGLRRAQRLLTCAWLPPVIHGFSRALPIRMLSAFTPTSVAACDAPRTAWQAGLVFIEWIRRQLDAWGRARQAIVVLADGAFDPVGLWKALPARVVLVTRTAKNRVLHRLPMSSGHRGRRRLYGAREQTPQQHLHARGPWRQGRSRGARLTQSAALQAGWAGAAPRRTEPTAVCADREGAKLAQSWPGSSAAAGLLPGECGLG
ncbi:MAG: hypothetical protein RML99_13085 [Anaerolineae bacterium]|nr:hypothetical protein [Anaerolineae bacterium]